jgi:hypothetical protein
MVFNQNYVTSFDANRGKSNLTKKPSMMKQRDEGEDFVGSTSFKVNRNRTMVKKEKNQVVITMNCTKAIPL